MDVSTGRGDIAIIGMGCRVPGANSPSELWDLLASSADKRQKIQRFNPAGFHSLNKGDRNGLTNVNEAYFLQGGIDRFDHGFFGISPTEATAMDPQHRILLEVAYETFESAGYSLDALSESKTAVYSGISGSEYASSLLRDIDSLPKYFSIGSSVAMAANRISYQFNLRGPSMVVDTACSSSATALHQAILALKAGDCDMALVSGGNLMINPDTFVHMSNLGFLSPSGISHSFDSSADGYARGEGMLAILIKPLTQALCDGDPIRSIIRGSSINQDGHTNGITLPSTAAQKQNMDQVYSSSRLNPVDIQYVEAHGTGTAVGDPTEMAAINLSFNSTDRQDKLFVGSVKSSIGHLEAGAALASIIKVVECLERGKIPPQKHFDEPNPKLDLLNIEIPTTLQEWPKSGGSSRRAAINSFGFGGTNGHLVLESWPQYRAPTEAALRPYVFKISASSEASLYELAKLYSRYISTSPPDLCSFAHTTLARRSTLAKTQYIIAADHNELVKQLETAMQRPVSNKTCLRDPIGFIFTGQGAQWSEMGQALLEHSKLFSRIVDECDSVLGALSDGPEWKLRDILAGLNDSNLIDTPAISQTTCTVLQLGLVEIWASWGVKPHLVVGHSSGEIAACYAAGVYSLRDAILIAYYRGKYVQEHQASLRCPGAMCTVGSDSSFCEALIKEVTGYATIAAINSPSNCTISGDETAIEQIVQKCRSRQIFCRKLRVSVAYHSSHMTTIEMKYQRALDEASCSISRPSNPFLHDMFSTVSGGLLATGDLSSGYWIRNLCSPVNFVGAVVAATKAYPSIVLLEIGPHPALKCPTLETLDQHCGQERRYFHSCHRGHSSFRSMLGSAVEMMESGINIDSSQLNGLSDALSTHLTPENHPVLTNLPSYPWDHSQSHWGESRASRELRFRAFPRHPLLGSRAFGDNPNQMFWRNRPGIDDFPMPEAGESAAILCTIPAAFCILMTVEALRQMQVSSQSQTCDARITELEFASPLPVSCVTTNKLETCLSLTKTLDPGMFTLQISSMQEDNNAAWTISCYGTVELTSTAEPRIIRNDRPYTGSRQVKQRLEQLEVYSLDQFDQLRIGQGYAEGTFLGNADAPEPFGQCLALAAALQIPGMLMNVDGFAARHNIEHISSLDILNGHNDLSCNEFHCEQHRLTSVMSSSVLTYRGISGTGLNFNDIRASAVASIDVKAPMQTLFLDPWTLDDISLLDSSRPMTIELLLELVTHKWPMSDIGVSDVSHDEFNRIYTTAIGPVSSQRRRFRSLNTLRSPDTSRPGVRQLQNFGDEQFHIIFGSESSISSHLRHLEKAGLACIRLSSKSDLKKIQSPVELVCEVTGLSDADWVLVRCNQPSKSSSSTQRVSTQVISSRPLDSQHCVKHFGIRTFFADGSKELQSPSSMQTHNQTPHIVVLDCAETSLLLGEADYDFLPWFQPLLESCKTLIWLTVRNPSNPFGDVASGFIKTLGSEYPTIRASNVIVEDAVEPQALLEIAVQAQLRLLQGNNEMEVTIRDSKVLITRYKPDDNLSVAVGLLPPRHVQHQPIQQYHELVEDPSTQITLRTDKRPRHVALGEGARRVNVVASVIDHFDTLYAHGSAKTQRTKHHLGRFFCGTLQKAKSSTTDTSGHFVGWHLGCHRSVIDLDSSPLFAVPKGMDAIRALSSFAAYTLAVALLDGAVRPLSNEVISIRIRGILGEALRKLCRIRNITLSDLADGDFDLSSDPGRGLLLNGAPVSLMKYLEYDTIRNQLNNYSKPGYELETPLRTFNLSEVQQAFDHAQDHPSSTVLLHETSDQNIGHWISAAPMSNLFSPDANYVVVGGLGGLGRHLVLWMVAHGAKHLVSLSRRGKNTPDAEKLHRRVESSGASLDIRTVDACSSDAMQTHFAAIRSSRPIRGCFNMCLQLENSPLATMTEKQWASAVDIKLRSSWNLHQASIEDELDMFVLFSSISSIAGNRTQANYAVGNSFQNSLARYRKETLGLPAISIALGAMSTVGVLANDPNLLQALSRSGLCPYDLDDFERILEAAILASYSRDRSLICTGLQRFQCLDSTIKCEDHQNQIFWSHWPEFGFLFDYDRNDMSLTKAKTLLESLEEATEVEASSKLFNAFSRCIADTLGRPAEEFDPDMSITSCGLDSLNTIACRYWLFKELHVDVDVFEILACSSMRHLLSRVLQRTKANSVPSLPDDILEPHHLKKSLDFRPASHSQQRMWFLHYMLQDKTVNNLLLECQIVGKPNVSDFSQAWTIFIRRHESLHSRIFGTPRGLQQVPIDKPSFPLTIIKITARDQDQKLVAARQAARSHIFNIEAGDLVRGWMLISDSGDGYFLLASHHIAWDRSSVPTIFNETSKIYRSLRNHESPMRRLNAKPYQFIDYTLWQNAWLEQTEEVKTHIGYWKQQLANLPDCVSLFPTAIVDQRPDVKAYEFEDAVFTLSETLVESLKQTCQRHATTPFMFMTSTLSLLVWQLTGDNDVVIGISDGDRGHPAFDDLVGFTVNMLAIRTKIGDSQMRYVDFINNYRETCLESYKHRKLPFDMLLQSLDIPRSTKHSQVFQIVVNYQVAGAFKDCDYGDFRLTDYSHYNARPQSDFKLDIEETSAEALRCVWTYDTALYSSEGMAKIARKYNQLLQCILSKEPETLLCDLSASEEFCFDVDSTESQELKDTARTILDDLDQQPFQKLFEIPISTHPDKKAIVDVDHCLTYQRLDLYTSRIATNLQHATWPAGATVGICCSPGIDMALAIYGVIRAGFEYVPLEIDTPCERLQKMMESASIATILTDAKTYSKLRQLLDQVPTLHHGIQLVAKLVSEDHSHTPVVDRCAVAPLQGFCSIFTSGTTGTPKGLSIGQRQLRYQMQSYHDHLGTTASDKMLLVSSAVFDMSLTSIYGTILQGATLVIASQELRYSPPDLLRFAIENAITHCTMTTTQLKFLLLAGRKQFRDWTSLRSVVVGGEEVPPWVAGDFYSLGLPTAVLFNGYGPSETTVCNALQRILPGDQHKPRLDVGKPLFPAQFHILDVDLHPVPPGTAGELYIGGGILNDGYLGREDITKASFITLPPCLSGMPGIQGSKIYKTGDMARLTSSGNYQILGRVDTDRQVKIRGMRVELNEIENAIYSVVNAHQEEDFGISLVAVVYHETERILAANFEAHESSVQSLESNERLSTLIQSRLKHKLPSHMIPSKIVMSADLPRTTSGKIDYRSIQATITSTRVDGVRDLRSTPSGAVGEDQHLTGRVSRIWQKVLATNHNLSSDDDFFSLGGHSLLLLQVQQEILEIFRIHVPLVDIFTNSTLKGLTRLLSERIFETSLVVPNGTALDATERHALEYEKPARRPCADESSPIDWDKEASLDGLPALDARTDLATQSTQPDRPPNAIAIVGACTMAGSHMLNHMLATTNAAIHCIGIGRSAPRDPLVEIVHTLRHWGLIEDPIPASTVKRIVAYAGSLFEPNLGLSRENIAIIRSEVHAIYIMDSDVSLLKNYEDLRPSNVDSLKFLVALATADGRAAASQPMAIHYLSTWGVPHLQTWTDTKSATAAPIRTDEIEMAHMVPGSDGSLGYLKARWVCEKILCAAATQASVPVTIYRACMCGGATSFATPLDKHDVNRRILEGILQTGLVPDFGSDRGGGMSWISADFLVGSIAALSRRRRQAGKDAETAARIYHVVSDTHVSYAELADLLGVSYEGRPLVVVEPGEWFAALRARGEPEMRMHAEVLETWKRAGWLPFQLDATSTLARLREEGIVPPIVDKDFLMKHVLGGMGF